MRAVGRWGNAASIRRSRLEIDRQRTLISIDPGIDRVAPVLPPHRDALSYNAACSE